MESDITSRRVTWIALALSLLSAGVGHVYCGRIAKGLPLYFAWLLVPLCGIIATMLQPSAMGLVLLLLPSLAVFIVYLYAAVDAWRLAHQIGTDYSLRDYNRAAVYWLLIVVQIIFSIGLIAEVRGFVYEAFVIPVNNMSPTILAGDRILARKLLPRDHLPERGDLIVYRNPTPTGSTRFMGRVVAVAGDDVEISGKRLIINGKELERDRVPDESLKRVGKQIRAHVAYEENSGHRYLVTYGDSADEGLAQEDFETTIPERHVFVLGDNRDRSKDSRHFGAIHSGDIVGCVDYVYWPSESWSRLGPANDRLP
jgi:signal peptidase I